MWKTLFYVVLHLSPGAKTSEDHWEWGTIFLQTALQWSDDGPTPRAEVSHYSPEAAAAVHQVCPKAISAPTHPSKHYPHHQDRASVWGWKRVLGRMGAGGLSEHSRQPLSVTTTMQCVANIQCIHILCPFLFATLVNCSCFGANFSATSATLSYFGALHETEIWQWHFNDFLAVRTNTILGHIFTFSETISSPRSSMILWFIQQMYSGQCREKKREDTKATICLDAPLPERPKCFCFLKPPAYWESTQNELSS